GPGGARPAVRAVRDRQAERRRHRAGAGAAHRQGPRRRPRARVDRDRRLVPAQPPGPRGIRMNARILVIDDDKAFQLLADEALSAEGFEVRTAGTIARGLTIANEASPDVVILDRRLPDGDGIDAIQTLRADGRSAPLVLIATAYGDVENAVEALRAGAYDYLTKPVQLADLVVKLHKVLENRGLRDRLYIARGNAAGPPAVAPTSRSMRGVN